MLPRRGPCGGTRRGRPTWSPSPKIRCTTSMGGGRTARTTPRGRGYWGSHHPLGRMCHMDVTNPRVEDELLNSSVGVEEQTLNSDDLNDAIELSSRTASAVWVCGRRREGIIGPVALQQLWHGPIQRHWAALQQLKHRPAQLRRAECASPAQVAGPSRGGPTPSVLTSYADPGSDGAQR